jgi:hypothetical protein
MHFTKNKSTVVLRIREDDFRDNKKTEIFFLASCCQ